MKVIAINPEMVKAVGSNAATLFAQLDYWLVKAAGGKSRYVVRRGPHVWVAKSRQSLCAETGLSPQMLRTAMEKLIKGGWIKRERHLFDNKVIAHFRIVGLTPDSALYDQTDVSDETSANSGSMDQTGLGDETQIIYEETEKENEKEYCTGAADAIFPLGLSGKVSGEGAGLKVRCGPVHATFAETKLNVEPAKDIEPDLLAKMFKQAWCEEYPDLFLGSFSIKQYGQFGMFLKKCPAGQAGTVLNYCVRNWSSFTGRAVEDQGAINPPNLPDIATLLRFVQSAVNCYLEGLKDKAQEPLEGFQAPSGYIPTPKAPKHAQKALKPDQDPPDVPTHEEVVKLLGLDM